MEYKVRTQSNYGETDNILDEMQMQIDTLSVPKVDPKEHEQLLKKKSEMEQEIAVLRRTLSSRGEEDRRKAKDLECIRDSAKALSAKNKDLRKELELRRDAEAESNAIKQAASKIEKENELLKDEVARLKKKFANAESRADEIAHLFKQLSKVVDSEIELNDGIQRQSGPANVVHSTPILSARRRTPSLSRNESIKSKKPYSFRTSGTTGTATSASDDHLRRKRGVMYDLSEPPKRRLLEFDVNFAKLSENNQFRQINHLKSHYDPETGAYDQSHGESPKSASRLNTPSKETRMLDGILRRK